MLELTPDVLLDATFGEDANTIWHHNDPQVLSILKKILLNLIRQDTTNKTTSSLRLKRKGAEWDGEVRMEIGPHASMTPTTFELRSTGVEMPNVFYTHYSDYVFPRGPHD